MLVLIINITTYSTYLILVTVKKYHCRTGQSNRYKVMADTHIVQRGGESFFKYIASSFCLHGYCHISRTLGSADHTL